MAAFSFALGLETSLASRFVLAVEALQSTWESTATTVFGRTSGQFGLPNRQDQQWRPVRLT